MIDKHRVHPTDDKMEAILNATRPKDTSQFLRYGFPCAIANAIDELRSRSRHVGFALDDSTLRPKYL